ncbi:type I secretion system permease/ATPase [Methylomonas fluvii]|uniref:Type I secretion system permease/ATPase n=1 Tax=Methylomonas fluvii TaxID=1854564 RepID=A0ABR9DIM9_9GAMM|nr:type I secretion system permease/ATPase [Methylomonas fluvii]MBD9361732.1 type I secretion system permease/ATPase [Methylomonas fluvii]CAD6874731.1 Type I secretion system ATPase [Methylomonas fluvii]
MPESGQITGPADSTFDDPLLLALLSVCKLLHISQTATALVAGLPLVDNKLTPALFVRAAERAGLSSRLLRRPLQKISNLVLPAVLLLKDGNACVLLAKSAENYTVVLPETESSEKTVSFAELQASYSGSAFFVQLQHRFDGRTAESAVPKVKHWFWDVLYKSWPIYAEVLAASVLINLFALAAPLFFMNVYDRVVPNHALETLWVLTVGVLIVFGFELAMKLLRSYFIDAAGKRADIILSANIFEKLMNIRMEARPPSVGAFANNLSEFESFREFLTSATLVTLIDLPFLFLFLLIIYSVGGNLALIPLAILPLAMLIGIALQAPLKNTINAMFKFGGEKNATLVEALSNLETIKTAGAEGQLQRRWEQNVGEIARLGLKSRFYAGLTVNLTAFLQQLASVLVVVAGVYQITDGDLTTGGLVACTMLTSRALAPVGQVAALLTRYHQAVTALGSFNRMMALPVERESGKDYLHRPDFKGEIEFKHVRFSYPQQPVKALDGISFKIKAGERVGFIGRIGSGKSTLEKLMLGLYQAQEGSILIDGTDIRQIDPSDLRRQIGYVPQDIALMFGSVKDNIVLGSRYADDAAVLKAAAIAGVDQFVSKHPAGFDLQVGERGASLSGGQRQSIALARALLLSPSIFIMDEPTNAMDNSSEEAFKQRFAAQLGEQTLILVTHRMSLLSLVDRLIVMDGGHMVADGPKGHVLEALRQGQIKVAI